MQPVVPDPAAPGRPTGDATSGAVDLFDAWVARVPEETVAAAALLPAEAGPPGTLFCVQLRDTRDYVVHFIDEGDQIAALLVDAAGSPILSQIVHDTGARFTFFPSGDSLDIQSLPDGLRYTVALQGSIPPTTITLDVAADGRVTPATVALGAEPNLSYPTGAFSPMFRAATLAESPNERCNAVAARIQWLTAQACEFFENTADIVIHEACEHVAEALEQMKSGGAPDELVDRLSAGLNLVCKGAAVIKEGTKFFKRLTPFGWVCLVLDLGEDLSVATTGQSISEALCQQLFPLPTPAQGCTPRTCPPGQFQNPLTCECECPAGMTFDARFNQCGCESAGGFGFRPGDPVHGCNCPGGRQNNADTGVCECPPGRLENPVTGSCDCTDGGPPDAATGDCPCGPGELWVADIVDDLVCISCDQALVEYHNFIADFNARADSFNELSEQCGDSAGGECLGLMQREYAAILASLTNLETLLTRMLRTGCSNIPVGPNPPEFPSLPAAEP